MKPTIYATASWTLAAASECLLLVCKWMNSWASRLGQKAEDALKA